MVKNIKSSNKLNTFSISIIIIIVIITFIALYLHFRYNKIESFDNKPANNSNDNSLISTDLFINFTGIYKNDVFIMFLIVNNNDGIKYSSNPTKLIYPDNKPQNIKYTISKKENCATYLIVSKNEAYINEVSEFCKKYLNKTLDQNNFFNIVLKNFDIAKGSDAPKYEDVVSGIIIECDNKLNMDFEFINNFINFNTKNGDKNIYGIIYTPPNNKSNNKSVGKGILIVCI
jgi:hypothetical protein